MNRFRALDARLRETLRTELFRLLADLGVTTIYVTHDQIEAMSLGYELIIMNAGRIEQAGHPFEVYSQPANTFVANFFGSTNLLEGECIEHDGARRLRLPFAWMDVSRRDTPRAVLGGHPSWKTWRSPDGGGEHFFAEFESSVFLGNHGSIVFACRGAAHYRRCAERRLAPFTAQLAGADQNLEDLRSRQGKPNAMELTLAAGVVFDR